MKDLHASFSPRPDETEWAQGFSRSPERRLAIESYQAFTKWLDFGGDVIGENELNEQQNRLRYIDLVASAVILQNTVAMMRIMQDMSEMRDTIAGLQGGAAQSGTASLAKLTE